MKKWLLLAWLPLSSFGQIINGQIVEVTADRCEIKSPDKSSYSLYIETEKNKITREHYDLHVPYLVTAQEGGAFQIDLSKIDGTRVNLYFIDMDFMNILLKNVPKEKLAEYVKLIPTLSKVFYEVNGELMTDFEKSYARAEYAAVIKDRRIVYKKTRNKLFETVKDGKKKMGPEIDFFDEYYYEFDYAY